MTISETESKYLEKRMDRIEDAVNRLGRKFSAAFETKYVLREEKK